MYKIICLVSFAIIVAVTVYGVTTALMYGIKVVGETFVNAEFPPPTISPIYAKPISWFMASLIIFWYSILEVNKEAISKFSKFTRHLFMIVAFLVGAMALYEVLFNFTLWGSLMSASEILGELNPDILISHFPNPEIPWNLVFATKIFLSLTIVSFYTFYFLKRLEDI